MDWCNGSALGILTIPGYAVFVTGPSLLWGNRGNDPMGINNEAGATHRNFVRHAVVGGFDGLAKATHLTIAFGGFMRTIGRLPRRINCGAILLVTGWVLVLFDFLIPHRLDKFPPLLHPPQHEAITHRSWRCLGHSG